ncbi:cytochrome c biogenesis protein CcsA [Paenibacillus senegalensis]|uniref:cytochrome c biogenesis protein CcsA n=1 Tax=Paenibacillus senegalensis TaxID=1465766 RepID=UPI0005A84D11|nr:cytochrome c biogenesis protein CcsA [Paenibacillus senegalensis]
MFAFILYCFAFVAYAVALAGQRWSGRSPEEHKNRWGKIAIVLTVSGFVLHLMFFFTRWYISHIPVSNMYEFMTFLSMMIFLATIIVYLLYRNLLLGAFAVPVGILIMAYASIFPREIQPLIPALQSIWLKIHVTMAAAGEAFFAVAFAAGLMYLIKKVDFRAKTKAAKWERFGVELTIFSILMILAFVAVSFSFNSAGYQARFEKQMTQVVDGEQQVITRQEVYVIPPLVKPYGGTTLEMKPFLGMTEPLFEAPKWMNGQDAGRQFNTVIWSFIAGLAAYGLLRLLFRKPLGLVIQPVLGEIDEEDIDEMSYRAIAIGYPIFTLGALIFAMIWAHEAWGRFWGWDPKEVWALITWLFYAAYLHLRLSRGWQGKKSAWLAVLGFVVVLFTLVGVNLLISGLHSYAGV